MNSNLISQIHDANAVKSSFSKTIKDGSSVLVRVIASKGDGKYEGAIAGIRTIFTAKNVLAPGTSFAATVSLKDGKILIIPKNSTNQTFLNKMDVVSFLDEIGNSENVFQQIENTSISDFISQFSLPPDKLSLHLLLQFKQLDMKFDANVLNKIRNLSIKFSGKEKKAVEIVSLMIKKGIMISEDELKKLLEDLDVSLEKKDNLIKNSDEERKLDFENIISEYIKSIIAGVNQDKIGIITVFNQCCQKSEGTSDKKWIFLPFEIIEKKGDEKIIDGKGVFKLFLVDKTNLRFLNIECNYKNKGFFFLLEFDRTNLVNVKFNICSDNNDDSLKLNIEDCTKKLHSLFEKQNVNVKWIEKNYIDGTACENEELFLFSGEI